MSIRGDKTHLHILSVARRLFAESGFCAVTVKEVAEACGLSRGGFYRHFSSTDEIFAEIIEAEQKSALDALADARKRNIPADRILDTYLKNRLKNAADKTQCIDNAVSEFAANVPLGKELLVRRAESTIEILTDIINACNSENSLSCPDAANAARHIIWTIEGMAKHNALIPITDKDIEAQLGIIFSILGKKQKTPDKQAFGHINSKTI